MSNLQKSPKAGERPAIRPYHIIAFILISIALVLIQPHYERFMAWLLADLDPTLLAAFLPITPRLSFKRFGRIILVNEVRETLAGVFPSRILAPYIGNGASLTGGLTIINLIATGFSVYFSYPALKAMATSNDLIDLAHPAATGLLAALAIAVLMFILINLFSHHFSNIFFRVLPLNILLLAITAGLGGCLGFADYTRMVQGTAILAEEKAGPKENTVLGYDPTTLGMIDSYYQEIAEQKQLISWCATKDRNGKPHGKGIIVKSDQPGQPRQVVCSHKGCTKLGFARSNYNATSRKAHDRINKIQGALQSLIDNHADLSKSYKELKESENAAKSAKQSRLEKAGEIASTYLYVFMLFSAISVQLITKQAAKRAIADGHDPLAIFGDDVAPVAEPSQQDLTEKEKQNIFDRLRGMLADQAATATAKSDNQIGFKQATKNETHSTANNSPKSESFRERPTPYNKGKQYDTKASRKAAKKLRSIYAETNELPSANALAKKAKVSWATAKNVLSDFQA